MNYSKFGLGLIFTGFMAFGHGVTIAESVANVRFATGLVTATAASQAARQLAKGDDIESGARVDTAANGRVQLRFTDGGLVSLMPDSTFSVEEYKYQDGADDGALVFGLLRGGLRTMTGAIGKTRHEGYELNTPVATLGIRGTQFTVVLNPPNTMRVHVGEGKVVITNSSGTLEVPAGRNAVVTLGSAPELTELGPMYQATGPGGDRLVAASAVRQDPLIGPPLVDLGLLTTIDDFEPVQGSPLVIPPTAVIPPAAGPSNIYLQDGPGYAIAAVSSTGGGLGPWQQSLAGGGFTGEFDNTTGGLLGLGDVPSAVIVQPGDFQTANVVTSGALSWGEFTDGIGMLNNFSANLAAGQYIPYVVGLHTDIPASGTLSYGLDGATAVRSMSGNPIAGGQLDKFDLSLNLDNSTYTLDMQLTTSDFGVYNATSGGGSWSGAPGGFQFTDAAVSNPDGCALVCSLAVEGFLAGPGAGQAGVGYILVDDDNAFIGAAGLKQ